MVNEMPLVSAIIIFLNAEKFIEEAIESVITQTYSNWELLLVDDGSTDSSSELALQYARKHSAKIRYFDHHRHQNKGMSASRNLGIANAFGEYVAFIDADDVWLDTKLETQVTIMEANPEAAMTYGTSLYWYSWTGNPADKKRDHKPDIGVQPDTLIQPPTLLPLHLTGKAAVPCPCSSLFRRDALKKFGGLENSFRTMYEDQVLFAKVCLRAPVFVSGACLDRYRQHLDSVCSVAAQSGELIEARLIYLNWLEGYLLAHQIQDVAIWESLHRQRWLVEYPKWIPIPSRIQRAYRLVKKWILHFDYFIHPTFLRRWLWSRR